MQQCLAAYKSCYPQKSPWVLGYCLTRMRRRARTFYSFSCQQCLKSNKTNFSQSGCLLDHFCKSMKDCNPACHSIRFCGQILFVWNRGHKTPRPVPIDFPNHCHQVGLYMNSKCKHQIPILKKYICPSKVFMVLIWHSVACQPSMHNLDLKTTDSNYASSLEGGLFSESHSCQHAVGIGY